MRLLIYAVVAILAAGISDAKTVALGDLASCDWEVSGGSGDPAEVNGCGFSYQTVDTYNSPPDLSLHDDSGRLTESIITYVGGLFSLAEAIIYGGTNVYLAAEWSEENPPTPDSMRGELPGYKNTGLYGYRGGELIASVEFLQNNHWVGTVLDTSAFKNIDILIFSELLPEEYTRGAISGNADEEWLWDPYRSDDPLPNGTVWCDNYFCNQIYADLTVEVPDPSPVPLPAGLPLLASAIGGIMLRKRFAWSAQA